MQGQYAPGSTFKPFTASSALTAGLIAPESTVFDTGVYEVPGCRGDSCLFRNDNNKDYGVVDLRRSLTVSSDFYYYNLGARFWIEQDALGGPEKFAELLERWGFYKDTGVDLTGEQEGRIPSPKWLASFCEQIECSEDAASWRTGNNVNMAIGQGDVLVTPLQLASAYATIGNGGAVWEPHVAKEIHDGVTGEVEAYHRPEAEWHGGDDPGLAPGDHRRPCRRHHARGRHGGRRVRWLPVRHVPGGGQDRHRAGEQQGPHGGVRRLRPALAPRWAVSVLLEESGYGGSVAAPVARRIFDVLSGAAPLPPAPEGGQLVDPGALVPEGGDVRD